ncbi:MAG: YhcH/YjgK/YiaL family protein [Candidatus Delongbacteria bacterium]|nr:YhcH/YjgK/YiaL family protein [Candidatus Delongbacteria bacterium]MCG2759893.1 YhcH/YjgK/YiaL family protein [Candidatus Delongbacteria bacterium]
MIFDKLDNLISYTNLHPCFEKAFEFIMTADLDALPSGRHLIDGEDIYVSIANYFTKEEGYLEGHKEHIDIQLITKGEEKIGFADLSGQALKDAYDETKDIAFYYGDCEYITLKSGMFAIFFPEDLHKPGIMAEKLVKVKKIVIKIRV